MWGGSDGTTESTLPTDDPTVIVAQSAATPLLGPESLALLTLLLAAAALLFARLR